MIHGDSTGSIDSIASDSQCGSQENANINKSLSAACTAKTSFFAVDDQLVNAEALGNVINALSSATSRWRRSKRCGCQNVAVFFK